MPRADNHHVFCSFALVAVEPPATSLPAAVSLSARAAAGGEHIAMQPLNYGPVVSEHEPDHGYSQHGPNSLQTETEHYSFDMGAGSGMNIVHELPSRRDTVGPQRRRTIRRSFRANRSVRR